MKSLKEQIDQAEFELVTVIVKECESHTHPIVQQECAVMDGMFAFCTKVIFQQNIFYSMSYMYILQ